jgi:hypothetical protein
MKGQMLKVEKACANGYQASTVGRLGEIRALLAAHSHRQDPH